MPSSMNWVDGPTGGTPLSAANLNKLAVVTDVGTAGTPTGDALRAAFDARYVGLASPTWLADASSMKSPALPKVMSTPPTFTSTLGFQGTTISSPRYINLSTFLTAAPSAGATALALNTAVAPGSYILGSGATAEPVTIASLAGTTATLAAPLVYAHTSGSTGDVLATTAVRFGGATRRLWTTSGSEDYECGAITGSSGSLTIGMATRDFYTDSTRIGLDYFGGFSTAILVDGELASPTSYNLPMSNGVRAWAHLDFGGVRQVRRITLIGIGLISRIAIETYATIEAAPTPAGPLVGIITDSYGQQPSTAFPSGGPFLTAMIRLGWTRFLMSAVGGTGYLNVNSTYTTFRQRIAADILAGNPDIVYVPGGLNDQGRQTKAALQTEATALFAQIRAALPNAWIVADAIATPNGSVATSAGYTDVRDGVKAAIQATAGPWLFIDNLTGGWLTSDGRSNPGAGQFQTGTGKGPVAPPNAMVQTLQGSGGTFTAGTYYWVVTATTAAGETTVSNELMATLSDGYTVTIAASGPTGSTGLNLYRGTAAGAENVLVGTFSPNGSITDTGAGSAGSPPGTNTSAATAGNGNADYYVADGTHTNPAGTDFLAAIRAPIFHKALRATV